MPAGVSAGRQDRTPASGFRGTTMTFDVFLLFMQQGIASGLVTGSVYALLAIAIVIVFRTTDVANFAEGEVYMASAYLASSLSR